MPSVSNVIICNNILKDIIRYCKCWVPIIVCICLPLSLPRSLSPSLSLSLCKEGLGWGMDHEHTGIICPNFVWQSGCRPSGASSVAMEPPLRKTATSMAACRFAVHHRLLLLLISYLDSPCAQEHAAPVTHVLCITRHLELGKSM